MYKYKGHNSDPPVTKLLQNTLPIINAMAVQ